MTDTVRIRNRASRREKTIVSLTACLFLTVTCLGLVDARRSLGGADAASAATTIDAVLKDAR